MVSVVVSTNRKNSRDNIINNFKHQNYNEKELIIVLNDSSLNVDEWNQYKDLLDIKIVKLANATLGESLNYGITLAKYDIIAKFDDDDYYAPNYLSSSVNTLKSTRADVVGKATIFIYYKQRNLLTLYKPSYENRFVHTEGKVENQFLFGATLVFKKEVWKKGEFRDIPRGIDHYFCQDSIANGYKLYASNRYNFVYIRFGEKTHHTSNSTDKRLLRKSIKLVENCKDFMDKISSKEK